LGKQGTGIYQCYCRKTSSFTDLAKSDNICHEYEKDMKGGYALSESVSVAITVVNSIIQMVMSVLIKMVGHHTESE